MSRRGLYGGAAAARSVLDRLDGRPEGEPDPRRVLFLDFGDRRASGASEGKTHGATIGIDYVRDPRLCVHGQRWQHGECGTCRPTPAESEGR